MGKKYILAVIGIGIVLSLAVTTRADDSKNVRLATDPWAPFYSPELKDGGYITALVREAFKRSGYTLEVDFVPWKRAVVNSKDGRYDGLLGAFHTKEREAYYIYSEPVGSSSLVFFTRSDRQIRFDTLKDLKNYQIGTIRGYTYFPEFDDAGYLNKQPVKDVIMNIKKLLKGRIDMFIDSRSVTLHVMEKSFPDQRVNVKILDPPLKINNLYVPISKKSKNPRQIIDALNSGLQQIKKDGTFDKIVDSYLHH